MKGYVRGFDVRTGKRLWIFHTIPRPGEFGNDTWENDSVVVHRQHRRVGADFDRRAARPRVPAGRAADRTTTTAAIAPGNNLFSESIVAVDLKTGKRRWHYQLVHHGMWDMDIPCAPILMDITVNGRTVKALAQPTKQAFLYVFNRETGEPIWPIEERPVPKGDTPGEWYSPTQPHPDQAARPTTGRGSTIDDLIDFTPELRAEAVKIVVALPARTDLHAAVGEPARKGRSRR